jgi:hypothetical protein
MKYEEAIMRKLAVDDPAEYIKLQRQLAATRQKALDDGVEVKREMYGFDDPR